MEAVFDFEDAVVVVTGAGGALGSVVAEAFAVAGGTVCAVDVVAREEARVDLDAVHYHRTDLTDEAAVERLIDAVVTDHDRIDTLCNIAGTWQGGSPIESTELETFERLFDINLKTMFLASKHALPHLQSAGGAIVSVSARSSLSGGTGDGPYRAAKAGVRLLTETIAEENRGTVRANAIMPSVIDTPMNREMMPDADYDRWVTPTAIADVVMFLCSDAAAVTSGAAVPVYGEA